jgi:hypothetical protein
MNLLRRNIALLCLLTATATVSAAEIDSDLVKAGIAAHDELDYPKCVAELEKALGESLTKVEKVTALKMIGFCRVALNQGEPARVAFQKLLAIEPTFELDRTISPRVRTIFDEAKKIVASSRSQAQPILADLYPARPKAGVAATVSGTHPTEKVDRVVLSYRNRGETGFNKVEAVPKMGGRFELTIPGAQVTGAALEFFVTVLDEAGLVRAQSGTVEQPQVADIDGGGKKKGSKVGVAVGVVVVLLALGGGVAGTTVGVMRATAPATVMVFPQ